MQDKILVNKIQTPDGTIIQSRARHHYVSHLDKNGLIYSVDGGTWYLRRNNPQPKLTFIQRFLQLLGVSYKDKFTAKELSVHYNESTPIEVIREHFERGGLGKNGKGVLKYVKLKDMSNDWVANVIIYEETYRPENPTLPWFRQELEYRKLNNILIPDYE